MGCYGSKSDKKDYKQPIQRRPSRQITKELIVGTDFGKLHIQKDYQKVLCETSGLKLGDFYVLLSYRYVLAYLDDFHSILSIHIDSLPQFYMI